MSKTLTAAERMAAIAPEATPVASLPEVVTITVTEEDGRGTRSKFTGDLDEAGTISVSLYLPEGERFPTKGVTLEIGGTDYNRHASIVKPNRRGSVKWAFGKLGGDDAANAFGAAAWVPAKAVTHTIVAKYAS